jgi:hypothetical protein
MRNQATSLLNGGSSQGAGAFQGSSLSNNAMPAGAVGGPGGAPVQNQNQNQQNQQSPEPTGALAKLALFFLKLILTLFGIDPKDVDALVNGMQQAAKASNEQQNTTNQQIAANADQRAQQVQDGVKQTVEIQEKAKVEAEAKAAKPESLSAIAPADPAPLTPAPEAAKPEAAKPEAAKPDASSPTPQSPSDKLDEAPPPIPNSANNPALASVDKLPAIPTNSSPLDDAPDNRSTSTKGLGNR